MIMDKKIMWKRKERAKTPLKSRGSSGFVVSALKKIPLKSIGLGLRRILIIILFFVLIISVFALTFMSGIFEIKKFEIYGVEQLSQEDILVNLDSYKGKNIFFQDTEKIKNSVSSSSVYLKDIYVEKSAPDTVVLYVVERFPSAVVVNFQGAYLVDQENVVVEVLSKTEGFDISQDERNLLTGFINEESQFVTKKIVDALPEDQRQSFDQATITKEEKRAKFQQLINELNTKIELLFQQNSTAVSSSDFANLSRIFVYSNDSFKVGESVDEKFVALPIEVEAYFRNRDGFTQSRMLWEDDFTLKFITQENKTFVFTDRRDIWLQTQDLDFILNYLAVENTNYSKIDVRSEVVSVE